jgi:hypothetical protein
MINNTTDTKVLSGTFAGNMFGGMQFGGAITYYNPIVTPPVSTSQIGWGFIV